MYERMLDKSIIPSFDDMVRYTGKQGPLYKKFGQLLDQICPVQTAIRFPYGKRYGWSVCYRKQGKANKHICDAFAEADAFTVHFRISNAEIGTVYDKLSGYSQTICDNKYPCGDGGWLSYRVLSKGNLSDVLMILSARLNKSANPA